MKTEITTNKKRICVNLLRNTKGNYFGNLNLKNISDNRKFWKTIRPYFSKKRSNCNKYLLLEKDVSIQKLGGDSENVYEHFINGVSKLKLRYCLNSSNKGNTFDKLIEKFKFRYSILKIKQNFESLDKFFFQSVTTDEVKREIFNLYDSKVTQCGNIPVKILKKVLTPTYLFELTDIINSSFRNGYFPEKLKMTGVFPILKKSIF